MNKLEELVAWPGNYGFTAPADKLKIYYSADAYAKTVALVQAHTVEVGWNMVIKPYKDGYKVYDILVYPQKVSPSYISVDVANWGLWKATLTDEEDQNLFGHGHSHVNMETFASMVDINQQHDEILTKQTGFYFFQIWNKRNSINSFFYDIDNKICYTNDDIDMIVECENENLEQFIADSFSKVYNRKDTCPVETGEDWNESKQVI